MTPPLELFRLCTAGLRGLLRPRPSEQPRKEPTLAHDRAPLAGSDGCPRATRLPESFREAISLSCPRCGAGTPAAGEAACILEGVELDGTARDAERTARALRGVIDRLEPRLV